MATIFKDLDLETLIEKIRNNAFILKVLDFIKTNKLFVRITSVCLSFIISIIVTIFSVGITVGFNVKYSGKVIATVQSAAVFETAKNIAAENVNGESDLSFHTPKYTLTITVLDKLDTAAKVADAIISNTDDFVNGYALTVNGETLACVSDVDLEEKVENRRKAFYIENAENTAYFVDDVKVESGYYLKKDIKDTVLVDEIISGLQVATVSKVDETVFVDFKTEKVKTNKKTADYSEVTQKGQKGVNRVTQEVRTLNGAETSRITLSEVVVSEPINKIVTVGTAPVKVSSNKTAKAKSSGFICPINSGEYTITSYFGDGRGHKGWDLGANKGVAIFASKAGTVSYAGYDSDYGYNVVINHGNGVQTRYAHANALCVSKGDTVAQGKMIATVGNTGRSTGNHLHFEIIVNGTRVNPANYIK